MQATHPLKRRNDKLFDLWSLTHIAWAALLAWVMNPLIALSIMVLWEPLEIFVLSPLMAKIGVDFGHESLRNSLSDIVFDVFGVILGAYMLSGAVQPPFYLFA
jgi:hypothetical protein